MLNSSFVPLLSSSRNSIVPRMNALAVEVKISRFNPDEKRDLITRNAISVYHPCGTRPEIDPIITATDRKSFSPRYRSEKVNRLPSTKYLVPE